MRNKCSLVALAILCAVVAACKKSPSATPLPTVAAQEAPIVTKEPPTRLQDRFLCGLTAPDDDASPWRQYWQYSDVASRVSALLKDGDWLWVGARQGLVRLDLQSLDCTLLERTQTLPNVSLAGVHSLALDPRGCLWASGDGGVARYCADTSGEGTGWQSLPGVYATQGLAFDAPGNLWTWHFFGPEGLVRLRYDGHEPPAGGEWQAERVEHWATEPPDDCNDWFSSSLTYDARWFQSPQECRALRDWQRRLASLDLPPGVVVNFSDPAASDGESGWLLARRAHPRATSAEQPVLLRWSDGTNWQIVPWPLVPGGGDSVPGGGDSAPPGPDNTLMIADQARSGVWIGTSDGLIFSNGQTVQKLPLTGDNLIPTGPTVSDVVLDGAARLWAATRAGLLTYDAESDTWQPTAISHDALITPDDQGGLWAVSRSFRGYISHLSPPTGDPTASEAWGGGRWRHYAGALPCVLTDIAADVGGGLWLTGRKCSLWGFNGQQVIPYPDDFYAHNTLLARGPDGELFAAAPDASRFVQRYDGATWEFLPRTTGLGNWRGTISLAADAHGGLWVGYSQAPYLRYLGRRRQDEFSDAVAEPVHALLVDSQGDLWVGLEGALLRYDGQDWERVPAADTMTALAEDQQGRIWAAGLGGFYAYEPRE